MIDFGREFKGRRAVVIGASGEIGGQVAIELAQLGAQVSAVGRRRDRLESLCGVVQGLSPVLGDVSSRAGCVKIVERLLKDGQQVDYLVYCAGQFESGRIEAETERRWLSAMAVNVGGFLWTVQLLRDTLAIASGKSIVVTSSLLSHTAGVGTAVYGASKGGLSSAVRHLALELAEFGIRVNAISPGHVETEMLKELLADAEQGLAVEALYPLGRIGQVGDIAPLAVFLLSSYADWITGVDIVVDGGRSLA